MFLLIQRAVGRCKTAEVSIPNSFLSGLLKQSFSTVSSDGGARYSAGDMLVSHEAAYAVN